MAVECNKYDIVIGQLRFQYNYDNMYRWKHLDSMNVMTNKLGWWTSISSRPRLWQTFKSWLQQEMFFVRSHNLAEEMKNFVKDDEEDVYAGGDREEFDDELMATMIALYTAHETDYNDSLGMAVPTQELTLENAEYRVTCMSCAHLWPTNKVEDKAINPSEFVPSLDANRRATDSGGIRCPVCGSRLVSINRNAAMNPGRSYEDSLWSEAASGWSPDKEWSNADQTEYDLL
jgi:DNA-directed RNA polymerase subunit RPC12/RpoP